MRIISIHFSHLFHQLPRDQVSEEIPETSPTALPDKLELRAYDRSVPSPPSLPPSLPPNLRVLYTRTLFLIDCLQESAVRGCVLFQVLGLP
jgi:hypothetical protein